MTADEVRAFATRHIEHWQAHDAAAEGERILVGI